MRRSWGFGRSFAEHSAARALVFILVSLAGPVLGNNYTVNSTADEPNADPSTGNCVSTPSGACTLRAAIMVANFVAGPNTITIPSGTYMLTRPGYDDNALVGDLDIKHDLTIQGAGSGSTIIDGNGSTTHDRVFQVLSTVQNVTMSGMTIRNGESLTLPSPTPTPAPVLGGGGLYIEGAAHVQLTDVIFDSNTAQNGGGIYANFSSTGGSLAMNNVIVRSNTAVAGGVGQGAGVYAHLPSSVSQFAVQDSQVYSNTADGTGGGFFVDGNGAVTWTAQRTQIYSNTAASGGGIGNFIPLSMSDCNVHDNHANFDGGAMEAEAPYTLLRTTLSTNSAARFGGGIFDLQTSSPNSNDPNDPNNKFAQILQSTLGGNFAQYGGGIYHDGFIIPASLLLVVNSTVSGNAVALGANSPAPSPKPSAAGGGIYIYGGQAQLLNTTVAFNRVQLGFGTHQYVGQGGGLYLDASATFIARNSVIANNARGNGSQLDTADDGYTNGSISGELAYDLITTTSNFFITGPQGGNIVGKDPLLSPLQDNGGPTQTRTLMTGSPAINAGAPGGCTDYTPSTTPSPTPKPLTTDQRGLPRPYPAAGPCDMGAVEVQPVLSITDVSMAEGNSGTTSFVFTVSLSPSSAQTVTVHFATADGTATAGSDYQATSNNLTFSPGDTSKTITVLVNGDTTFEPDETFFVNLSSAVNAQIAKAQGIGTILNDDPGSLGNISTRLQVGTGNNVLFAGFIIQGNASKTVLIRSAGPSLASFGVPGVLSNPQLELHDANNTIGMNDDWQTTQLGGVITSDQVQAIRNSGAAPADPAEPAIIATLPAGGYTAIVKGVGGTQGVATAELYDLSPNNGAILANISTRGFIQTGDNVMIGGFIVVSQSLKVLIRATGPSLTPFGINDALANPRLELHDANGTLAMNDDWQTTQIGGTITSDQSAAIQNSGLAPSNSAESAIIATLAPGNYTAIAQGVNGGTGVGLVEVFAFP